MHLYQFLKSLMSSSKVSVLATDKMDKTSVAVPTVVSTHEPRDKKSCCPKQSEITGSWPLTPCLLFLGVAVTNDYSVYYLRGGFPLWNDLHRWSPLIISHSFVFLRIGKTHSSPDFLLHPDKYTKQSSSVSEASNENTPCGCLLTFGWLRVKEAAL